jgi:hypothetical protein
MTKKKTRTIMKIGGSELAFDHEVRSKDGKLQSVVLTTAAAAMGQKGGTARGKRLSKAELSKIGKLGAAKRWGAKKGAKP